MTTPSPLAVEMTGIVKRYPGGVTANDGAGLRVPAATLHALVGENGAGKSTLLHILFGRVQPDAGEVRVFGEKVVVSQPSDAIARGLGLVSQHSSLISNLTVIENLMLGQEPRPGGLLDPSAAILRADGAADALGVRLDWRSPVRDLSVAKKQLAEIVRALVRGARVLLLDEPTAMLSPSEADSLFALLRGLVGRGTTVILVTHRLADVLAHASGVTVLRAGKTVAETEVSRTNAPALASAMVGTSKSDEPAASTSSTSSTPSTPSTSSTSSTSSPTPLLAIEAVSVRSDRGPLAVRDFTLHIGPGEVVGVAGVDGSGQAELAEAIAGLRELSTGTIRMVGERVERLSAAARIRLGLRFLPEDRLEKGLIPSMTVEENLLLGYERTPNAGGGALLSSQAIRNRAARGIQEFDIRGAAPDTAAGALSGGNQQKLLLARSLSPPVRALIAMQPARGLDFRATRAAYDAIRHATAQGACALVFSLDLDEVLEVSDRVAVLHAGRLAGVLSREEASREAVGSLMLGGTRA